MLYHFVGMSFSSRRNLVLSPALVAMRCLLRILWRRDPVKSALTIRKGDRPCQYRRLLDSPRRRGCHGREDRKSTRLNSSHVKISYAVSCLKKKRGRLHCYFHSRL